MKLIYVKNEKYMFSAQITYMGGKVFVLVFLFFFFLFFFFFFLFVFENKISKFIKNLLS